MSYKRYNFWRTIVVIVVATLVSWSVVSGNAMVPAPTVIVGIAIVFFLRKNMKEVVEDERVFSITDKAAMMVFRIFSILAATAAGTLLALSQEQYPDFATIGFTLAYSVCVMLAIYYAAYFYYHRKYSGKD